MVALQSAGRGRRARRIVCLSAVCLAATVSAPLAADVVAEGPDNVILFTPHSLADEPLWAVDRTRRPLRRRLPAGRYPEQSVEHGHDRRLSRRRRRYPASSPGSTSTSRWKANSGSPPASATTTAGEGWAGIYLRFDGFPWNNRIRTTVGISTGLDYLSNLPDAETSPDGEPEEHTSHVLHYLSPEITFALPKHPNQELVIRLHHRSGLFGAIGGVSGGSNVVTVGFRHRW